MKQRTRPPATAQSRNGAKGAAARKRPTNTRAEVRRRRRRRRRLMGLLILLTGGLLIALVVALVALHITGRVAQSNGTPLSFLSVKEITVEGDTRYSKEELIEASGIYVGESLLVVNKVQAHDALLRRFPYLEWVEISNVSFSRIQILVKEAEPLGAVETAEGYVILGSNNHALEIVSAEALDENLVKIYGAQPEQVALGEPLLDERSKKIVDALMAAVEEHGVETLTRMDLSEKTNIRAVWREQILLVFGNETNLAGQLQAFQAILPTLLKNNGEKAVGKLDMTTYSDDDAENDRAIFSPLEELPSLGAAAETPPAEEPTDETTSPGASDVSAAA